MTASARFAVLTLSVLLLVASCGQKGPLTLPEEGPAAATRAAASDGGSFPGRPAAIASTAVTAADRIH